MYNSEIKKAFILDYSLSINVQKLVRQIFASLEQFESLYGCDISLFSQDQLQQIVDAGFGVRKSSTELVLNILKRYVKWRANHGYEVSQSIFSIRTEASVMLQEQMVSSPLDLKMRLDNFFAPPEQLSIDCTHRAFLWMAYSGIPDSEAVKITADEVNLHYLYIEHNGHKYEIYKEGIRDFENACNLREFWFNHLSYSVLRERADGNLIMRGFLTSEIKLLAVRPVIAKKLKGSKLSYNRIQLSGTFYRARERERIGIPVDFSSVVDHGIQRVQADKGYTLDKKRTLNKISKSKIRSLEIDYERWKNAFDV